MAEERAMDRGASSAIKTQEFTDGIYEDAKTDMARGGSVTSSNSAKTEARTESYPEERSGAADREFGDDGKEQPARDVSETAKTATDLGLQ